MRVSSTLGMQYLSVLVASLSPLKSNTILKPPLGLGTPNMGLLYGLLPLRTMPILSHAAVWSLMAARSSLGILNCGLKIGVSWVKSMVCSSNGQYPISFLSALKTSSYSMSPCSIICCSGIETFLLMLAFIAS